MALMDKFRLDGRSIDFISCFRNSPRPPLHPKRGCSNAPLWGAFLKPHPKGEDVYNL